MSKHIQHDRNQQSLSTNNSITSNKNKGTAKFIDNRAKTVTQRRLKETANNSPQSQKAAQLQAIANQHSQQNAFVDNQHNKTQSQENKTGLPDDLKSGIENLSGYAMDDIKVHRNSSKPAQLQAHAYAQGTDIHLASGQEKHLPHEAWHVVQQKQGRVKPTMQMKGKVNVNDDVKLEKEADRMGAKIAQSNTNVQQHKTKEKATGKKTVQRQSVESSEQEQAAPQLTNGEKHIFTLRNEINTAAAESGVDPSLVAAILLDEYNRRGPEDSIQDLEARFIIAYEGWLESTEVFLWESMFGDLDTTSFGDAQMNLGTAEDLVENGYVDEPADWDSDRLDSKLRLTTNSQMAPYLVAGRLRQTIDHWSNGGVDISNMPDILGTLYSIGLTGQSGVNPDPRPNPRGTQIAEYMPRMSVILNV